MSEAFRIGTNSAAETRAIAASFGRLLDLGDVVCLCGDLGAGKTTFTQGLAAGIDIPASVVVNSPTFTLLAEHEEGRVPLYHFDVYRLSGPADLYDLAFDEYLDGSGVAVIEWADRVADALPKDAVVVTIAPHPSTPTPIPEQGKEITEDVPTVESSAESLELGGLAYEATQPLPRPLPEAGRGALNTKTASKVQESDTMGAASENTDMGSRILTFAAGGPRSQAIIDRLKELLQQCR